MYRGSACALLTTAWIPWWQQQLGTHSVVLLERGVLQLSHSAFFHSHDAPMTRLLMACLPQVFVSAEL
jgi:hypothetical protein